MPDRLVCNSMTNSGHPDRPRRGVIFISTLAVPFVAAFLVG
jgi:hypothetical protein